MDRINLGLPKMQLKLKPMLLLGQIYAVVLLNSVEGSYQLHFVEYICDIYWLL